MSQFMLSLSMILLPLFKSLLQFLKICFWISHYIVTVFVFLCFYWISYVVCIRVFQMISNKLLVVPSPIGGVLVVCANTIHYHSQSASCILALNNYVVPGKRLWFWQFSCVKLHFFCYYGNFDPFSLIKLGYLSSLDRFLKVII